MLLGQLYCNFLLKRELFSDFADVRLPFQNQKHSQFKIRKQVMSALGIVPGDTV